MIIEGCWRSCISVFYAGCLPGFIRQELAVQGEQHAVALGVFDFVHFHGEVDLLDISVVHTNQATSSLAYIHECNYNATLS